MKNELSKARRDFLQEASNAAGTKAVEYYPPLKWALAKGYVEGRQHRFSTTYYITDAGKAVLGSV
jgi:hypothetical protein